METEKQTLTNSKAEKVSVPPGFVSLSSFTLRRVQTKEVQSASAAVEHVGDTEVSLMSSMPSIIDAEKFKSDLWLRPWILDSKSNHSVKESNSELEMVIKP